MRNFLLLVEGEGGFLVESDPLLDEWAAEVDEAKRSGLFGPDCGLGIGFNLTPRGKYVLDRFRQSGAVTLASYDQGYSGAPGGLVLARKSDPDA